MTRLGVVVPVLSAFKEAIEALESIRTKCIWTPYIAPQWKENKAISEVWNVYSSEAFEDGCDFVLIINDDIRVFPKTVDALVEESKKGTLLVSGESMYNEFDENVAIALERSNLNFSCFIIRSEIFKAVGYFDENFYPAYFEDNDFHYRMIQLGFPAYGIKNAPFFHRRSTTQQERLRINPRQAHADFAGCKDYYIRKWGGEPGSERFKTPFNKGGSVKEWTLGD